MSDIVSVELTFDETLEAAVRREWDALQEAALSSLAAHTAPSNRPHITLLVRPELTGFSAADLAARLPLPLTLGAPMLFGGGPRRVLVRSVVPTAALLDLHAAVHSRAGEGDDVPYTRPESWMPHVTLARRLRVEDLAVALPLVGGALRGTATMLRRWEAASAVVIPLAAAP